MTLDFSGWVGSSVAAKRIGVTRQSIDAMVRRGNCGAKGEGWVWVPTGGSGGGSYLLSPSGVQAGRAYWKGSRANPKNRKPKG